MRGHGASVAALLLTACVVSLVRFVPEYRAFYSALGSDAVPLVHRARTFALFTISTIVGWEFLHRGFLLFGLRRVLAGSAPVAAGRLALVIVALLETTHHMAKPWIEIAGMGVASPLFSLIALRTGSVVFPLLLHLEIEIFFFPAVDL